MRCEMERGQDLTGSIKEFKTSGDPCGIAPKPDAPKSGVDDREQSERFRAEVILEVGAGQVELWFDDLVELNVCAGRAQISAGNQFTVDRIQRRFNRQLRIAAKAVTARSELQYVVSEDLGAKQRRSHPFSPPAVVAANQLEPENGTQLHQDADQRKRRTVTVDQQQQVQQFVFCDNNRLANSSVEEIINFPGQISPVLFYGPTGCGKTELLQTVRHRFRQTWSRKRIAMMSSEEFTSAYVGALNGKGLPMFRRLYRDLDLLLIDDITFFRGKRATTSEFQHTIDGLLAANKQIVLTSDRPPSEMDFLSHELVARLTGGLVCPVRYANEDARKTVAHSICQRHGFDLNRDVIGMIANRFSGDMRRISGAINRLRMTNVDLDATKLLPEQAENQIRDLTGSAQTNWSINEIEKVVCRIAGVTQSEIRSNSRQKKICTARMLAMWLSRQHTRSALSEIGSHFGGRSHSTVIAATRKVDKLIQQGDLIQVANANCPVQEIVARVGRDISEAS